MGCAAGLCGGGVRAVRLCGVYECSSDDSKSTPILCICAAALADNGGEGGGVRVTRTGPDERLYASGNALYSTDAIIHTYIHSQTHTFANTFTYNNGCACILLRAH